MSIDERPAYLVALAAFAQGQELTEEQKAALADENERLLGITPVEE